MAGLAVEPAATARQWQDWQEKSREVVDGVALRGDGEDLVDGVQVELGRRGDVGVRAARDRRKHKRNLSSDTIPYWNNNTSKSTAV